MTQNLQRCSSANPLAAAVAAAAAAAAAVAATVVVVAAAVAVAVVAFAAADAAGVVVVVGSGAADTAGVIVAVGDRAAAGGVAAWPRGPAAWPSVHDTIVHCLFVFHRLIQPTSLAIHGELRTLQECKHLTASHRAQSSRDLNRVNPADHDGS